MSLNPRNQERNDFSTLKNKFMIANKRYINIVLFLIILLVVAAFISLFLGSSKGFNYDIIYKIRLPRIILAIIVGSGLSLSGAILQGITKNPLADPYILGASGGAAVGVAIGIVLKLPYSVIYPLAIISSGISTIIAYTIGKVQGQTKIEVLVLSGVIVNIFTNAIVLLLMSVFYQDSHDIMFFLMGSLQENNKNLIIISGILVLVGFVLSFIYSNELNIISQGEETAFHLGVSVEKIKWSLFFVSSIIVGSVVAVSGVIGFMGLIIPHIARVFVGANYKRFLVVSLLLGSLFLVVADTVARTFFAPFEIPVGVITALTGVPFFVYLLMRKNVRS